MRLLEAFIQLVEKFEGCKLKAYTCPAGVWTIGFGATGRDIKKGVEWTQKQADDRMFTDVDVYATAAAKLSPGLTSDANKHSAIADFCYNLGTTRYKASTLKRKVDAEEWDEAEEELAKWVWGGGKKLPGLVRRRAEEARLLR